MGSRNLKILVLGGYGSFGSRVVEFLGTDASLKILVAGRSGDKAEAFCRSLETAATLVPLPMDRNGYFEATLREVRPDLIIDASGPFQDYGKRPYRVVEAAIDCGAHYIDLADASGFGRAATEQVVDWHPVAVRHHGDRVAGREQVLGGAVTHESGAYEPHPRRHTM